MNGVELEHVADCWATDLAFVNVDSAVLLSDVRTTGVARSRCVRG